MTTTWTLDERDGELVVITDREGPAARMGHQLTIEMTRWRAEVTEGDDGPVTARLVVDVAGLQVRSGDGGLKPLSRPEREVARRTALRALGVDRHPRITFDAVEIRSTAQGHDLTGHLSIHGVTQPRTLSVESLREQTSQRPPGLHCDATVSQSDHGVKPVSFLAGALRVSDDVEVVFTARR